MSDPDTVQRASGAVAPTQPRERARFLEHPRVRLAQRRHVLIFNIGPHAVSLAWGVALLVGWAAPPSLLDLACLLIGWFLTATCISVGFHRHLTHRAFDAPGWLRASFAIGGMMAAPGPVISWVATHRCHHQLSDKDGDPHSPNLDGDGLLGKLRGLYHAHFGWMAEHRFPNPMVFASDLLRDPLIVYLNRRYHIWVLVGLLVPPVVVWFIDPRWQAAVSALMWGGFIRIVVFQHAASGVNSFCHLIGTRPFKTADGSRNNVLLALAACGEGWHNNHHAFPTSAFLGLRWWQIDPGAILVRILRRLGLVWNVRAPSGDEVDCRRTGSN